MIKSATLELLSEVIVWSAVTQHLKTKQWDNTMISFEKHVIREKVGILESNCQRSLSYFRDYLKIVQLFGK